MKNRLMKVASAVMHVSSHVALIISLFAFAPLAVLAGTLGEGLNCPSLEWTTGGTPSYDGENVNWSYCSDDSYSDGACVVSGAGGWGDATSWIKAMVAGPCKISFRYKVQTYNGTFKVMDGSTTLYEYTGVTGTSPSWQYKEFDLAAGSHEIKIQYRHPGMGYAYQFNGVKVDEFTVTANATLASALDAADLTFTTGGNAEWFPQTSVTHDGEDAVRSGAISGSQSTWMQTTVTGAKQISFWWKTSSEANYDILRFYVDGTEKASVSGTTDWSLQTVQVTGSGTHTLKWQYSKDGSVDNGDDCAWVDQVTISEIPVRYGGLVAWYKFDGNPDDSSGNEYDGRVSNGVSLTTDRFGNENMAYYFNGQSQEFNVDNFNVTNSFSVSIWFKTDVTLASHGTSQTYWNPGNYLFFPLHGGSNAGCGLKVGTDGVQVVEHGSCYMPTVLDYRAEIGTNWNHVVMTLADNGDPVLYLNGQNVAVGEGSTRAKSICCNIGGSQWGHYTGSADDVRIYDYALSASEVDSLFRGGSDIGRLYYVNGTTGNDANAGLSASTAKKTIQAAIDAATDGSTIIVADGTYSAISVEGFRGIIIKSANGPLSAIIDGNNDTMAVNLNCDNRSHTTGAIVNQLIGFTVQRGYATGTYCSGATSGGLSVNCIFRQNYASGYGAGSVSLGGVFINCIAYDNEFGTYSGGVFCNSTLYNCTLCSNNSRYGLWDCTAYNTVNYASGNEYVSPGCGGRLHNTLLTTLRDSSQGNIVGNPLFKDAENKDFGLTLDSPCIDAGNVTNFSSVKIYDYEVPTSYFATDIYGNARVTGAQVDIGAIEYGATSAQLTYYVNGTTGDDSNSGLSATTAKKTIQAAIDAAANGGTILVAAGTYSPIDSDNKPLRIVANDRIGSVVIDGGNTQHCVNAISHIENVDLSTNTIIQGFVLQNGSAMGGSKYIDGVGGCLLSGIAERCIIRGGRSLDGGGAVASILRDCLLCDNYASENGGAADACILVNCTIVNNRACDNGGAYCTCVLKNCIVYGNEGGTVEFDGRTVGWRNSLTDSYSIRRMNVFTGDPKFVDAANGDYRLSADSPCINVGSNAYVTTTTDLDGNVRIVDGVVDLGCYEFGSSPAVVDGLVAWYKFDGNVNDSSFNRIDLSVEGSVSYAADRLGRANSSIKLKQNTLYATQSDWAVVSDGVGVRTGVKVLTNSWSVSCWFKTDVTTSLKDESVTGISGDDDEIQYLSARYLAVGKNGINVFEHEAYWLPATLRYDCDFGNTWHHLVLCANGKDNPFTLYLDGTLVRTGLSSGRDKILNVVGWYDWTQYEGIGKDSYGKPYDGFVDDFRFYNRSLTAAEVSAIYNEGESDPTVYRTVTFNANGGTTATGSRRVEDGAEVGTLPTATRTGYRFLGWFTEAEGGTQVYETTQVAADVTYYAHWTANEYTIAFSGNGATGGSTMGISAAYGADVTLTANGFTRTGYAFAGWSTLNWGSAEYAAGATVRNLATEDGATVTLYAVWTPIDYSVSYYGNGSDSGYMSNQWFTYDSWENLNANQYGKTGYSFDGWATTSDGAVAYDNGASVVNLASTADANVGLYAKWTVNQYTVTFNANGGSTDMSSVTRDYGTVIGAMTDAWRTGYDFLGWFTAEDGGEQVSSETVVTADVTWYAHWQKQADVQMTLYVNGTTGNDSNTGHSEATAKKTIQAAVDAAFDNDTIYVASGTYAPIVVTNKILTIESISGALNTVIDGRESLQCANLGAGPMLRNNTIVFDSDTLTTNHVKLIGFTLQHGCGDTAAIHGGEMKCCIVKNCMGTTKIAGNCLASNCLIVDNKSDWNILMHGFMDNCTVVSNRSPWVLWDNRFRNGILHGNSGFVYCNMGEMECYSCLSDITLPDGGGNMIAEPHFLDIANDDYRLAVDSPCIDAGDNSYVIGCTDLDGNARIANGKVDIGCYEYAGGYDPIVYRAVIFDANGGTAAMESLRAEDGAEVGELPTATRTGYDFLGWFTAEDGGEQVSSETVVTTDVTWYAHWELVKYDITYLYLKGAKNSNQATYTIEDVITFAALEDEAGYRFVGWSPSAIAKGSIGNKTITAQWEPIAYAISYVDTKGAANPNPTSYTVEDEVTFAALPDVDGWKFIGWSLTAIAKGSVGGVTVSANWEKATPDIGGGGEDDDPMDASIANTYDGVIVDADGLPLGYINVKTAKATGKGETKTSKVTATIQMAGEAKKVTVRATVLVDEATMSQESADGRILDLSFSHYGICGTFDGYEIEGVRNLLASTAKSDKGTDAKTAAEAAYAALKGNYAMAFEDDSGWSGLSVSVTLKGMVRVSGKLANGTSISTSTQLIVGEEYSVIPVIYTKGATSLAFNIYFSNDGQESEVFGCYDAVISSVEGLGSGLSFYLGNEIYDLFEDYSLCDEFLPYGISVEPVSASKWSVANGAKAGLIKLKEGEVVDTKESDNPSGLKLTFTARTGAFKGSFKVYALDSNGKLKTFSATVSGVVVDGVGYGVATIKKIGSCAVMIAE